MSYKVILCDIEGTTTSISFVKENLFPYAADNVSSFLDSKWDADDTKEAVKMLRDQAATDTADKVDGCVAIAADTEDKAKQIETLVANVKWQMEHDRKAGPLKNLQGLMWVDAYKAGAFKGQVYDDVAPAFESWTKAGRKVYIYSSGSAAIQKVHFEHSGAGDLAKHLSGYFDTKVGAKQDKASYEAIFKEIASDDSALNTGDVLFLTDIPAEAKAAKEAGMEAMLLKRPGNAELSEEEAKAYTVVESFADIPMTTEAVAPKRKIDDVANQEEAVPPAKVAKIEAEETVTAAEKAPEDAEMKDETAPVADAQKEDEKKEDEAPKTEKMDAEEAVVEEAKKEEAPAEEAEKKTEEEAVTGDVPMEEAPTTTATTTETEKTEEDKAPATATDNDNKKKDTEAEPAAAEEKKEETVAEEAKKPAAEEDQMEVDSTTTTAKEGKEEVKSEETPTTTTAETEKATEEKPKEAEAKPVVEKAEEETKDSAAPVPATEKEEEKKEPETDKEEEKVTASTETSNVTDDVKSSTPAIEAEKPTTNGDSAEAKPAETPAENGKEDTDSDKENDKSMEAKPDEVTTTQEVSEADEAAAKKLAEIDAPVPVAPASEVEAES